jgi:hypothetical protein
MEAEKLFIEGIKEDKFFYIDNFEDGISCNLFNKDLEVDVNMKIFNSNINNLLDKAKLFNTNVILQKDQKKYNLLFLVKKPIIKEPVKNTTVEESIINNPINFINKLKGMFGEVLYKVEYSNLNGGKIYTEKELKKIIMKDNKRKENSEKKKNKISQKDLNKIISNRCENFDNIYKNTNIIRINIFDIPELKLVQNIFHIYYLILFNYILPNIYINYKNINKIEKIDIDFNSLINKNKVLKDSLETIFFITKNKNLYNEILDINNYLNKIPYQIDNIEIILF